jgi:cobalt ECF transporter T component CbiQ
MSRGVFLESTLRGFARALSRALVSEHTAKQRGLLQALDPRVRVAGMMSLVVASTLCRRMPVLVVLFAVAVVVALASRVSLKTLILRVWLVGFAFTGIIVLPAIFTTPGTVVARVSSLAITEQGLRAAALLVLRVETAITFTSTLVLATPWTHILRALRSFHLPAEMVTMLAMTHRYIFLLIETANQMFESRQSRVVTALAPAEQRRMAARTAGVLLNKSIDLSNEVYLAMQSRGFRGDIRVLSGFEMKLWDYAGLIVFLCAGFAAVWVGR